MMISEAKEKGKETKNARGKWKQTESKVKGKARETEKIVKLKATSKDKALKVSTASSNWLALQKKLPPASTSSSSTRERERKRRKLDHVVNNDAPSVLPPETEFPRYQREQQPQVQVKPNADQHEVVGDREDRKNGESLASLRRMVLGEVEYDLKEGSTHLQPGKYLALDCEMVGIGIDGSESSLARVTLVNYHGYPILDSFVLQKERVVDYRTRWSGIREGDLTRGKAKSFEEVQTQVAELIKDRILVGHAVYNDLKALLLPHPRPLIRDTQHLAYAGKPKITKSKYISLRNLVLQELDLGIQDGEHSSLTDARATMAVFRLWRRMWEASPAFALTPVPKVGAPLGEKEGKANEEKEWERSTKSKRKMSLDEEEPGGDEERGEMKVVNLKKSTSTPKLRQSSGKGRKGISSGLSTIVTVRDRRSSAHGRTGRGLVKGGVRESGEGTKWWKEL